MFFLYSYDTIQVYFMFEEFKSTIFIAIQRILKKFRPKFSIHYIVYTVLFFFLIFSVVSLVSATTPNPGHPWAEVGDGVFAVANTQTGVRTYTFPDANATILTTDAVVTVGQGGIGVGTLASNGILYGNGTGAVQALPVNAGAVQCLTQASSGVPAWGSCGGSGAWDTITAPSGNQTLSFGTNTSAWTSTASTQTFLNITANSLTTGQVINIPHTTSVIANGGSLLSLSSSSVDTATTTGTLLNLTSTGSTAGTLALITNNTALFTGITQAISMTGQTTGTGLSITGGGANLAAGGKLIDLQMGAATAGTAINVVNSGAYTGTGLINITANGLTTGTAINIPHTTSVIATGGSLLRVSSSSVDTNTTQGTLLDLSSTASTSGVLAQISDTALTTGVGFKITHATGVLAAGGSLMRIASTSNDTNLTQGNLLDLSSTASTAGTQFLQTYSALAGGIGQSITTAVLTTGNALKVTAGGTTQLTSGNAILVTGPSGAAALTGAAGGVVNITAAGAYTTAANNAGLLNLNAGTATGVVQAITANALTTGTAFLIPHTTSIIANGGSLLRLSSSSVDTSTTTGTLLDLSSTASTAGVLALITNNTASYTGNTASISMTGATTGKALAITLGGSISTGGGIVVSGANYNHASTETGTIDSLAFTDSTTSSGTSPTTNGLLVSPTISAGSGTATRTINGISVNPSLSSCAAGSCAVNALAVGNVTDGTGFTTSALNVGTGWDTILSGTTAGTNIFSFTNATLTSAGALTVTSCTGCSGSSTLVVDTTPTSGGTIGNVFFHKTGNVVGEMTTTGTGTQLVLSAAPTISGTPTFSGFTNTNGMLYTNGSGVLAQTATGGAGTLCLTSASGGTPTWGSCSGTAATAWSSLTAPSGNLSLAHGTNTSTFTWVGTTTQTGLTMQGGSAMTTGGVLSLDTTTYTHGASETGSLANFAFTEGTTGAFTTTTNGVKISPTISAASGAATRTINGISIEPSFSSCAAGTCAVRGVNIANVTDTTGFTGTALNIGTGWDEAIRANGTITIGAQADTASTGTSTSSLNSAAGTFGSQTANDRVTSSIVFRGKLFVAVAKTNAAGVYRYDGGTTWTLVTNTPGKAVTGDATDADAFIMTVYNDKLYIANQTGAATGAIYSSSTADTTADSFTMVNATRGTSGMSATTITGYTDMEVYNGQLIVATQLANLAEIGRYDGGTTFTQITATDGKSAAETTADKDGFILQVYNGYLYAGSISGSTTNIVAAWNGNGTTWTNLTVAATGGTFGADTVYSDTNSMVVYNGNLYVSMSKTAGNAAAVYMLKTTTVPVAAVPTNFIRVNTTVGKLIAGDAVDQDSIILGVYNGRLYGASSTGSTTAALYEYPQAGNGAIDWTLMNTTRGAFGSDTGVDSVTSMVEFNGSLYLGTFKTGAGSVYTWTKTAENSFALRFDSGGSNYGAISFIGNRQASNNGGHFGTFNFTNSISLSTGAFDYAEDYPTYDATLEPGDVVAIDPTNIEYVKRADGTTPAIGIYSKNPGLRLQKPKDVVDTGETWIPIALVGRVPLKVTIENGEIKAGDSLALSATIPGTAMKATKAGTIIARALSGYNADGVGMISAFIDNSYSNGAKLEDVLHPIKTIGDDGAITLDTPTYSSRALLAQFIAEKSTLIASKIFSDIVADRVAVGLEIITPSLITDSVSTNTINASNGKNIGLVLDTDGKFTIGTQTITTNDDGTTTTTSNPAIVFDSFGNATFNGTLTAKQINVDDLAGVSAITDQINTLSEGQAAFTLTAQVMNTLSAALTLAQADIVKLQQDVLANTTTLSGLALSGTDQDTRLKIIEGFLTKDETGAVNGFTVNTLTVSGDSSFAGKAQFDGLSFFSNTTSFTGGVTFAGQTEFSIPPLFNKDTAGFAVIKQGDRRARISFDQPYITTPVVNTSVAFESRDNIDDAQAQTLFSSDTRFIIVSKDQTGFTILLNKPAVRDIRFSWNALSVRDPKVFESVFEGLVVDPNSDLTTPNPTPTPDPAPIDPPTPTDQNPPAVDPTASDLTVTPTPVDNTSLSTPTSSNNSEDATLMQ